jgi:hypothetical protein
MDDFVPALLRRLSTEDPQRAIEVLKQTQQPNRRMGRFGGDDLLLTAYSTWLKQDEKGAIAFGLQGDDADAGWLARALAQRDRTSALAQLDALPPGSKRNEFIRGLAREFQNPADGLQWSRSFAGEERTIAIDSTLGAWTESDPLTLARQFDQVPELRESPQALRNLIWKVQNSEAAAAVPLLDLLADATKQDYGQLAHYYAQHDPRGASEWISSLPEGERRDAAIGSLVGYLERTDGDYEAAFAWAGAATDAAQHQKDLERVAERWLSRDATAARAAIEASSLAAETKSRLLKK